MHGKFSIDIDRARNLIRISIGGFFTSDDLARFTEAWREARARLRCSNDEHLTLVDTRAAIICTQEMVSRWSTLAADPAFRSRRLAFIIGPTLVRMQLQRAIGETAARVFIDEAEAEAWLSTDEASAAA